MEGGYADHDCGSGRPVGRSPLPARMISHVMRSFPAHILPDLVPMPLLCLPKIPKIQDTNEVGGLKRMEVKGCKGVEDCCSPWSCTAAHGGRPGRTTEFSLAGSWMNRRYAQA